MNFDKAIHVFCMVVCILGQKSKFVIAVADTMTQNQNYLQKTIRTLSPSSYVKMQEVPFLLEKKFDVHPKHALVHVVHLKQKKFVGTKSLGITPS